MSENKNFLPQDDDAPLADSPGAQTSNKEGLRSSARKPSNSGPDPHSDKHKAPVSGAFGNEETRDYSQRETYIGDKVPADKAIKK